MNDSNQPDEIAFESLLYLGNGIAISCYCYANKGTVRFGLEPTSELLGYALNYFSRLTKGRSKKLKELQDKGFTAYIKPLRVARKDKSGASQASTLSFDDFCTIIEYEAIKVENPKAIALMSAAFREVLLSRVQEALGIEQDPIELRRQAFQEIYDERASIWEEEQAEVEALMLPGDEGVNIVRQFPTIAAHERSLAIAEYEPMIYPEEIRYIS